MSGDNGGISSLKIVENPSEAEITAFFDQISELVVNWGTYTGNQGFLRLTSSKPV